MIDDGKRRPRRSKTRHQTKRQTSVLRRDALPNVPPPRHRQPTINDEKMAAYLSAAAKFEDTLKHDYAELRKSRLKLDEIVQLLNSGADPASITDIVESAIEQLRATIRASQTLDDLKELKTTARELEP